jgi:hypothetical protein
MTPYFGTREACETFHKFFEKWSLTVEGGHLQNVPTARNLSDNFRHSVRRPFGAGDLRVYTFKQIQHCAREFVAKRTDLSTCLVTIVKDEKVSEFYGNNLPEGYEHESVSSDEEKEDVYSREDYGS